MRIINLRGMFRAMLPELSSRAGNARGELGLVTEFGRVDLLVRPRRVALGRAAKRDVVELSQEQLFPLVFGLESNLTTLGIRASRRAASLIRALFPSQPAMHWMLDGF